MYKKTVILFLFVCLCFGLKAQKRSLDSLYKIINTSTSVKIKVQNFIHVWWWYLQNQQEKKALETLFEAKKIAESVPDSSSMFISLGNIGYHHNYIKNYGVSIFYLKKAMKWIPVDSNYIRRKIGVLNNLSQNYQLIGSLENQKIYLDTTMQINKHIKDKSEDFYTKIVYGNYLFKVKKYDESFLVLDSAIKSKHVAVWEKLPTAIERLYNVFSLIETNQYLGKKELIQKAEDYFEEYNNMLLENPSGLTTLEKDRDKLLKANYYFIINDFSLTQKFISQLEKNDSLSRSPELYTPYLKLKCKLYERSGEFLNAKLIYEKLLKIADSTIYKINQNHEQSIQTVLSNETQLEQEKQEKQEKIILANQSKKTTWLVVVFSGVVVLILVIGVLLLRRRFKQEKKQKIIISKQKSLVDEKQKEIIASINYAKRIQKALLPNEKYISKHINKPKH